MNRLIKWLSASMVLLISACGGGGSSGSSSSSSVAAVTYTVGGTVSGLTGSGLVLQNNGGNDLAITASGAFTFSTALIAGSAYAVTVATHPGAQNCTVANSSGTVSSANVGNVAVTCTDLAFTTVAATMNTPRALHTATLLPSGLILITGGVISGSFSLPATDTAELYDPATQSFTALSATLTTPRGGHTATLLANGKVLFASGFYNGPLLYSAELYDPVANTFTALSATLTTSREWHTATLLPNNTVLIAGGHSGSSGPPLNTTESFDPATNTFTAASALMTSARVGHTATLLANGQVLLTGGTSTAISPTTLTALSTTELYNPATNNFTALAATMNTTRAGHTATLLANGKVIIIGGVTGTGGVPTVLNTVEAYGP